MADLPERTPQQRVELLEDRCAFLERILDEVCRAMVEVREDLLRIEPHLATAASLLKEAGNDANARTTTHCLRALRQCRKKLKSQAERGLTDTQPVVRPDDE